MGEASSGATVRDKIFSLCVAVAACVASWSVAAFQPAPQSPQELFQDLFVAVQTERLYPDNKAFPDALPKSPPAEILERYHALRSPSPAALKQFVEAHFTLPLQATTPPSKPGRVSIVQHIDDLWDRLTRDTSKPVPHSSALSVPKPYVVPGGRFREMYYWDSYFTLLGLAESNRHDLVESMVSDFAYLIDTYGHVPNGTRTYYLTRSQPPFFFSMVGLLSDDPPLAYERYLPELRGEYAFWMEGEGALKPGSAHRRVVKLPDGAVLNRYWDDRDTPRDESYYQDTMLARESAREPTRFYRDIRAAAESGWDFSSRWFADGRSQSTINTTEIVPVDLNSLLYGLETAIRLACERKGDKSCAHDFEQRASRRKAAIDRYLWDAKSGAYLDYHWAGTAAARVPRISAATLYPLFTGVASTEQAAEVAKAVTHDLLEEGGIVATTVNTGQQWDSPNGWPPLQWIAVAGLRHYDNTPLAEVVACRWMLSVNRVYNASGKLVEKYDVTASGRKGGGGEYPLQDGFGWTNGVMRKLMALYPADAAFTRLEQCPKPQ